MSKNPFMCEGMMHQTNIRNMEKELDNDDSDISDDEKSVDNSINSATRMNKFLFPNHTDVKIKSIPDLTVFHVSSFILAMYSTVFDALLIDAFNNNNGLDEYIELDYSADDIHTWLCSFHPTISNPVIPDFEHFGPKMEILIPIYFKYDMKYMLKM